MQLQYITSSNVIKRQYVELNPESLSVEVGFPIPIVSRIPDSLNSQFQSPGFLILQEKISRIPESQFPYIWRKIILTDFRQSYVLLRLGGVYPLEFRLTLHGRFAARKIKNCYLYTTSVRIHPVSPVNCRSITSDLNPAFVFSFACQC